MTLVETEELLPSAGGPRREPWRVRPPVLVVVAAVAAVGGFALAVVAPFLPLFVSTTTTAPSAGEPSPSVAMRFAFDGWGRPLTARSIDSIGFPFAGHGPSFGVVTVGGAAVIALAVGMLARRAGHGARWTYATWLGFVAGAALTAVAGAMWLTVQPGVQVHGLMTRTTEVGPCVWLTAGAGVAALVAATACGLAARAPAPVGARAPAPAGTVAAQP